jgi:hypothetical protein
MPGEELGLVMKKDQLFTELVVGEKLSYILPIL